MCHSVPYKQYTSLMTQSLSKGAVEIINHFASKNSISDTMIPFTIVECRGGSRFRTKWNIVLSYTWVYVVKTNTMNRSSTPEISLKSSKQSRGDNVMSLYTGKILHSYIWEEPPVNTDVIRRV